MNRLPCWVLLVLGLALVAGSSQGEDPPPSKTRNPFGVDDVPVPDGDDVKDFAQMLPGGPKDPNAEQWVEKETEGKPDSLDGEWSVRWKGGDAKEWVVGTATIKPVKSRVYILCKDERGTWLVELLREGKHRLVGRYMNVKYPRDSTPVVALIVDPERIDGLWEAERGRVDFRRKLKK